MNTTRTIFTVMQTRNPISLLRTAFASLSILAALCFTLAVLCLALAASPAAAQPGSQQTQVNPQSNWADSLQMYQAENEALTRILGAIESIDTARQSELIQWIITDRNIRSRVISALRKSGKNISPNSVAELTVTQKPPTYGGDNSMQLLRLVIEQIGIYGEPNIRRILGPDLYDRIHDRSGYEYTLISSEPAQKKIQFVYLNASLFGGEIIFKSGFGFALKVGNDYLGYPFWLPGTIGTLGLLRRGTTDFRLGLEWPLLDAGVSPYKISGGFQVKERKLMGTQAFVALIDQSVDLLSAQSGKLHFGAEFFNAFKPSISSFPSLALEPRFRTAGAAGALPDRRDRDSLYYIGLSTHGYVSYNLPPSILQGAYIQVGGGTHRITATTVGDRNSSDPNNVDLSIEKQFTYVEPFIKLGYVRNSDQGDEYGLSVQYSNTLLADGFIKLFPWLQLEAKYSTIIGRDPRPWEWQDYVMVSPKITLNF